MIMEAVLFVAFFMGREQMAVCCSSFGVIVEDMLIHAFMTNPEVVGTREELRDLFGAINHFVVLHLGVEFNKHYIVQM